MTDPRSSGRWSRWRRSRRCRARRWPSDSPTWSGRPPCSTSPAGACSWRRRSSERATSASSRRRWMWGTPRRRPSAAPSRRWSAFLRRPGARVRPSGKRRPSAALGDGGGARAETMIRVLKWVGLTLAGLIAIIGVAIAYVLSWPDFGGSLEGARLERARRSPQYRQGAFANDPPPPDWNLVVNLQEWMGHQVRRPPAPFPSQQPRLAETPEPGLRAIWFGHATVLLEIDGRRVMTDPMLSRHAFPLRLVAPVRFNPPPMELKGLPHID